MHYCYGEIIHQSMPAPEMPALAYSNPSLAHLVCELLPSSASLLFKKLVPQEAFAEHWKTESMVQRSKSFGKFQAQGIAFLVEFMTLVEHLHVRNSLQRANIKLCLTISESASSQNNLQNLSEGRFLACQILSLVL